MPDEVKKKNAAIKKEKNPAAVALGRLGGLKGGPATAKKLSAEQRSKNASHAARINVQKTSKARRSEIARMGALARWKKEAPKL